MIGITKIGEQKASPSDLSRVNGSSKPSSPPSALEGVIALENP